MPDQVWHGPAPVTGEMEDLMADDGSNGGGQLLTPSSLAEQLPSRPLLTTADAGWQGLTLQRYRHPPSTIDLPGLGNELLVDHLVGPVLVEEHRGNGRYQRCWTGPGQVTLTPAGQPVRRILKGRPDVVLLHVAPEILHEVAGEIYGRDAGSLTLVPRLGVPDGTADRLVRLLLAEAEAPGSGASLMTETLGRALAIHLLRWHSNLAPRLPEPAASRPALRIQRVIEQMRSCLDENLSLAQLAAAGGLSPSQLVRTFRGATGQPPHRYLRALRIEKARELLEQTELPVTEIGLRCGFEQPSHFATAFRTTTGLSPRAWRQARRS